MNFYETDTIAAIATPAGEGGVGVIRISGPDVWQIADALFLPASGGKPSEREHGTFAYGQIIETDHSEIDNGLCLIFRAPKSFTGEDTVEIQGHGGAVNLRRILRRVLAAGARMAQAGEFTKRAFLNGKMDLIQAEAVADLIHARSDRAAAAAVEQMAGSLSKKFDTVYDGLITIAADLEATLDFMEDELPEETLPTLAKSLATQLTQLDDLLCTWDEGRLLREGARVVILGRPNAGKSTLLNLLLGFDRAIVSDVEGTTRDLIEEGFSLDGIPLRIIDTAGLRETDCAIEQEGIRRAHASMVDAHLPLYLIDASVPLHPENVAHFKKLNRENTIIILNKVDQCADGIPAATLKAIAGFSIVESSLIENRGAMEIKKMMAAKLEGNVDLTAPPHAVISERHRQLLVQAQDEGKQGLALLLSGDEMQISFVGQHLRTALELIGEATGKIYHDSLLDTIFSRFCVGK